MNQNWIVQSSWIWKMLCKKKNKKKHFFPWNVSIPSGLQHSCCPRRLCMGPMELEFLFFFLETFQSHWGCSIAIVPNGYAWVPRNLKIILEIFYFLFFPLETFQSHKDCSIVVVNNGYAWVLRNLIIFLEKIKTIFLFLETFQSLRGCSVVVILDGYAWVPWN
jgi:hypothetical protein